jgi:hypothetical protein
MNLSVVEVLGQAHARQAVRVNYLDRYSTYQSGVYGGRVTVQSGCSVLVIALNENDHGQSGLGFLAVMTMHNVCVNMKEKLLISRARIGYE